MPAAKTTLTRLTPALRREAPAASARPAPIPEPRGVVAMLDAVVDLYRTHFATITTAALLCAVPLQLGYRAVASSGLDEVQAAFPNVSLALASVPAQLLVAAFAFGLVGGAAAGRTVPVSQAAVGALRALPALLGVFAVALAASLATCGAGLAITPWLLGPAVGLIVLEHVPLGQLLARTLRLAAGWGSFGRWLGLRMVGFLVLEGLGTIQVLLQEPGVVQRFRGALPLGEGVLAVLLFTIGSLLVAISLGITAMTWIVFTLDLRVRRDGLDLSRRLRELESREAARGGATLGGAA